MFGSDYYEANDWFYSVLDSNWYDHYAFYNQWHTCHMYYYFMFVAWL